MKEEVDEEKKDAGRLLMVLSQLNQANPVGKKTHCNPEGIIETTGPKIAEISPATIATRAIQKQVPFKPVVPKLIQL